MAFRQEISQILRDIFICHADFTDILSPAEIAEIAEMGQTEKYSGRGFASDSGRDFRILSQKRAFGVKLCNPTISVQTCTPENIFLPARGYL